jgi:D-lyxose ketol-isomerase
MKRSEINRIMREAIAFAKDHQFYLPPFAYWTPSDWQTKGSEVSEIVANQLGWDITDFGSGDYARVGLFLFTIRNGNFDSLKTMSGKVYAEKLLITGEGQVTPMHFHWQKMEDIINSGGGNLVIQLYNSDPAGDGLLATDVAVQMDGVTTRVPAGGVVTLRPGESISLPARLYHKFWGEAGRGTVLVGEVSRINDDHVDNHFLEPCGRFPEIVEDEAPLHLLYNDYARYYHPR